MYNNMYTTIVYEWNSLYTFIQDETLVKLLSFSIKLSEQLCSIQFYDVCNIYIYIHTYYMYRCNLCIITSVSLRVYIFYSIISQYIVVSCIGFGNVLFIFE